MNKSVGLLLLALSTLIASACESTSPNGQAAEAPSSIANLALSVSPASAWSTSPFASPPLGENVALQGYATASARDAAGLLTVDAVTAHLATDGDPASVWSSQQPAPQWFSVALDDLYLVNRIQLQVTQAPAGPTTHEIWLGNGSGTRTLFTRLPQVYTDDGQLLDIEFKSTPASSTKSLSLRSTAPAGLHGAKSVYSEFPSPDPLSSHSTPRLTLQPIVIRPRLCRSRLHMPAIKVSRLFVAEKEGRIRVIKNGDYP